MTPPAGAADAPGQPPFFERFGDYLAHYATKCPHAEAAVLGDARVTYRALASRVEACAAALMSSGVRKGDRVAMLTTPRTEYLVVFLALARIGALWVGLNPRHRFGEFSYVVEDAAPRVLIGLGEFEGRDFSHELRALMRNGGAVRRLVMIAGGSGCGASTFDEFLAEGERSDAYAVTAQERGVGAFDPLCIVYTSGSTGAPKGAVLTHRSFVRCYTTQFRFWPIRPLRILSNLPVNHIGGLGDVGGYCLIGGGTQVFMERFDPHLTLDVLRRERVSVWFQLQTQFRMVGDTGQFEQAELPDLQLIAWGDKVPMGLARRLSRKAPRLATTYGLSEACGPLTFTAPDASLEELSETIGRPVPDYEVRISDADGQGVPAGVAGELQVRGDFVMAGYFNRPEQSAEVLDAGGWLRTGDLARQRPDGNYELVGRLKDMYKSGGYNVYPREVELVLESHPEVALAAVIGVPDPLYHEIGHAFVVAAETSEMQADELYRYCKASVANYKIPKKFHFRAALPMLANGKVDKQALRQELAVPAQSG